MAGPGVQTKSDPDTHAVVSTLCLPHSDKLSVYNLL